MTMRTGMNVVLASITSLLFGSCASPSFVDVTVVNRTEYSADVSTKGTPEDSALTLGYVGPQTERHFKEVIDQGETWIFNFGYTNRHEEQVSMQRSELERGGWKVEVPVSFGERLREMEVPPPP